MTLAARTTPNPNEDTNQSPRGVGGVISFETVISQPVRAAHPLSDELRREMESLGIVGNAPTQPRTELEEELPNAQQDQSR